MNIIELSILSNNLVETEKFYTNILGFKTFHQNTKEISFKVGASLLRFVKSESKTKPIYHFAFNIPNNKLHEAFNWLDPKTKILNIKDNEKFVEFKTWNARAIYFIDNNKNILEFIARNDLDNTDNKTFNNNSIVKISEIGVAVDNVLKEAKNLKSKYKIEFFSKQQPFEDFAPMGNDNGLIILTKHKRNWFSTDIPAEKHKTKIIFEQKGQTYETIF